LFKCTKNSIYTRLIFILYAQLFYFVLVVLWNIAGVVLIANDLRAPGPTANLLGAGIVTFLALILIYGSRQKVWLYAAISALSFIGAAAAIFQAFTADISLWPSDFWRYCGVTLNLFGAVAHSIAIFSTNQIRGVHLKRQ